jgi:hypothetical protein
MKKAKSFFGAPGILALGAFAIAGLAHAEQQNGALSAGQQDQACGGGFPRRQSPPLVTAVEHPGCVEVQLTVPHEGKIGDKTLRWRPHPGGGLNGDDETNLRTKDSVSRVGWNSKLEMTLSMPGIHRKLDPKQIWVESHKLYNYAQGADDESMYGSFLLFQHPSQHTPQYGKNQAFDAAVFYLDGEANLPRKATVDCQQMSWFDPSAMEWGKCYWLSGDSIDPRTGKPYCW